ncbi:MAG: transcriptional repressor [Victivallaceae bacterium]|nr:transcriptional repressor [Victivallaceae bacterium]
MAMDFNEACERYGWKRTQQRLVVFEAIRADRTHPGVDDVWEKTRRTVPKITRESVYRILNEFADAGLISRLDNLSSARYDSFPGPHGHVVCPRCGKVVDFDTPDGIPVPDGIDARNIQHLEVRLTVVCDECKSTGPAKQKGE